MELIKKNNIFLLSIFLSLLINNHCFGQQDTLMNLRINEVRYNSKPLKQYFILILSLKGEIVYKGNIKTKQKNKIEFNLNSGVYNVIIIGKKSHTLENVVISNDRITFASFDLYSERYAKKNNIDIEGKFKIELILP